MRFYSYYWLIVAGTWSNYDIVPASIVTHNKCISWTQPGTWTQINLFIVRIYSSKPYLNVVFVIKLSNGPKLKQFNKSTKSRTNLNSTFFNLTNYAITIRNKYFQRQTHSAIYLQTRLICKYFFVNTHLYIIIHIYYA